MTFAWPQFTPPIPLDGTRSFAATFDSYDQRNEDCYYVVTIYDGGEQVGRFVVRVSLYWVGDDWTGPGFVDRLRDEIKQIAATGKSNTDYRGQPG